MPMQQKLRRLPVAVLTKGPGWFGFCSSSISNGIVFATQTLQRNRQLHLDNILLYRWNKEKHDINLKVVHSAVSRSRVTLNEQKCCFAVENLGLFGHWLTPDRVYLREDAVAALDKVPTPTVSKMVAFVSGHGVVLTTSSLHLTTLLSQILHGSVFAKFVWADTEALAFNTVKMLRNNSPSLTIFDTSRMSVVAADALSYGLRAVPEQNYPEGFLTAPFASRTLTEA